jgi:hypothetical protein
MANPTPTQVQWLRMACHRFIPLSWKHGLGLSSEIQAIDINYQLICIEHLNFGDIVK